MVVYYREAGKDKLSSSSYCFISDSLHHSTSAVYEFQKKLVSDLKLKFPSLKKIHYFSDGCGGQYKNRFNFSNLCNHEADFGVKAEWNFFATSHGKNPCDGIGGTLKRMAYKQSLRAIDSKFILNATDFYEFVNAHSSINSIFVPTKDIHATERFLESRFSKALTVEGTKSYHKIIPISQFQLKAFHTSKDEDYIIHDIYTGEVNPENIDSSAPLDSLLVGSYMSCLYEKKCYIAIIESV